MKFHPFGKISLKAAIAFAIVLFHGFAFAQAFDAGELRASGFTPFETESMLPAMKFIGASTKRNNAIRLSLEAMLGTGYWQKSFKQGLSSDIFIGYDRNLDDTWTLTAELGFRPDMTFLTFEAGATAIIMPYSRIDEEGEQVVSENGIVMTMYRAVPEEDDPDMTKAENFMLGGSVLASMPLKSDLNWSMAIRAHVMTDLTFERTRTFFVLFRLSPGLAYVFPDSDDPSPALSFMLGASLGIGMKM